MNQKKLLSRADIEDVLGVGRDRAREIAAELPFVRVGRFIRYPMTAVDAWIEQHTEN